MISKRETLGWLITARSGHGHFAAYQERFNHDLHCSCGLRRAQLSYIPILAKIRDNIGAAGPCRRSRGPAKRVCTDICTMVRRVRSCGQRAQKSDLQGSITQANLLWTYGVFFLPSLLSVYTHIMIHHLRSRSGQASVIDRSVELMVAICPNQGCTGEK